MPAHRSKDEWELRAAVVERLRELRPTARIIHEINVNFGNVRVDVMAVSREEIVTVEIKSKRDKLDRLPKQIEAMKGCSHISIAALHEKFLVEIETNEHVAHRVRDGLFFWDRPPEESRRAHEVWAFPLKVRCLDENRKRWDAVSSWRMREPSMLRVLPPGALHILWSEELHRLCCKLGIKAPARANKDAMCRDIRWLASGKEITRGICDALRRRDCLEADPPIETEEEAA
ncbi:hypothetical protein IWQ49_006225 [Labrenzia sp. EL_126]|nr:hypothetical protein [Labrenzia sp. EL_126]